MFENHNLSAVENKIVNKKILFFSAKFFGYDIEIKNALSKAGASVEMYDDRPSNSTLSKVLIRIDPLFLSWKTHKYFKKVIRENDKSYDYVLFITCEAALKKDLSLLKKCYPSAKFILYLYDSLDNLKRFDEKMVFFDNIYTFDPQDIKLHSNMKFLPLFYLDSYKKKNEYRNEKYDVSFIGTSHSDRPYIINSIKKQLDDKGKEYYFRLFTPSKIMHFLKIIYNKDYRVLNSEGMITLNKTSAIEIAKIIENSKMVVDMQHPNQTGLTMRSIELLGMEKKFVTTNVNIVDYDFYKPSNIQVLNRESINLNIEFVDKKYEKVDMDIYNKYSLNNWIMNLFQ